MIHYLLVVSSFGSVVFQRKFFLSSNPTIDLPPTIGSQLAVFCRHITENTHMILNRIHLGALSWSLSPFQNVSDGQFFCAALTDSEMDTEYSQIFLQEVLNEFARVYRGTSRREMNSAESKKLVGAIQTLIGRSLQATIDMIFASQQFLECHLLCKLPPDISGERAGPAAVASFTVDRMNVISPRALKIRSAGRGAVRQKRRSHSRLNWARLTTITSGRPELLDILSRVMKSGRDALASGTRGASMRLNHCPADLTYEDGKHTVVIFSVHGAFLVGVLPSARMRLRPSASEEETVELARFDTTVDVIEHGITMLHQGLLLLGNFKRATTSLRGAW
eukprot:gnl/Chilomastix_cuspidata/2230.p2 GENE.gnl/Chilomastix_cuspidata/2230~~gnl/Chilomastix_cuspidata/2230.p2  ORF type:complete len:335 (+),score=83.46 gnl/Chilomastix_cuspidata/2230:58-1062(+)